MRIVALLLLLLASPAFASGHGHGAPAEEESLEDGDVRYVTLQPTFVTNYGFSETGRLKYLKADVTCRVATRDAEMAVRYHLPALRNELVLLFSRQDESGLTTSEGREQLRQDALTELRSVMKREEGQTYIDDLVFENFVVQR